MTIGLAAPIEGTKGYFYKNADVDEMIFIHKGEGILKTMYGNIEFAYGDYVIIPRGTIYQLEFATDENRILIVESHGPIETPDKYKNKYGQYLEHSPFCERDLRGPVNMETHDEEGEFLVKIKKRGLIYPYVYENHPFDLKGRDGCSYPYAFSIFNFEPITGRITLHPGGLPHGPHPGAIERSIGKTATNELAVMIDPFIPVKITKEAMELEFQGYYQSWVQQNNTNPVTV